MPRELLTDIAEHFLESPVWHLCQLGETTPNLGEVFMDDALWTRFYEDRFRDVSRSPRRGTPVRPMHASSRLSYAELHSLEMRFREGKYSSMGAVTVPKGVAVLDLRIEHSETSEAVAFAAMRDGRLLVYNLDHLSNSESEEETRARKARRVCEDPESVREFAPAVDNSSALSCCPISQGNRPLCVVTGYGSGRLCAWQWPDGRQLAPRDWESAHLNRVSAVTSACDRLVSASADGLVKVWDIGEQFGHLRQTIAGHSGAVMSVSASPSGHTLVTGGLDRSMRLWDLRSGGEAVATWELHDWAMCVDFHPTSEHTLVSADKAVNMWDLRQPGERAISSMHRHQKLISRFRLDPLRLVTCSLDGCVKVSSLEEPAVRHASPRSSPLVSPRSTPLSSPQLSPTESQLLSPRVPLLGDFGSAWSLQDKVCTLRSSKDYILCIDFDASRLLAGGVDGQVHVYNFSQRKNFKTCSRNTLSSDEHVPFLDIDDATNMKMTGLPDLEI